MELVPVKDYKGYFVTKTGRLFSSRHYFKEVIGSPDKDGYLKVTLIKDGKLKYKRKHRVIAEVFIGKSKLEINHKDGNKKNNNIENLEYVSLRENQCHRRTSDVGVCWDKKSNKWRAYIQDNKKWYHLGFYTNKVDAKMAYIKKAIELKLSLKYAI